MIMRAVKSYKLREDEDDELEITLWVDPFGQLSVNISDADDHMDIETAAEVGRLVRRLTKMPSTVEGAKLIEKARQGAEASWDRINNRTKEEKKPVKKGRTK